MIYRIVKSHAPESLATEVNLAMTEDGRWKPQGGPFLEPYSSGHGPCLDPGSRHSDAPTYREPVFVNFCQALVRE